MAKSKKAPKRDVKYPELSSDILVGDKALTIEQSMELIGWQEEPEGEQWGADHCAIISKMYGKKVRLLNNAFNRPIPIGSLKQYIQEILQGNWILNGENMILGCTGQVMSAQTRLCAHILAEKERLENLAHWKSIHPNPIVLETFIAYGVEETDQVFRTLNTGKPATVSDTLYRSPLLAAVASEDRNKVAKVLDRAIGKLWHRLGYDIDQWADIRTNTEAQVFLVNHATLVDCCTYLHGENKEGGISDVVPLGTASALFYLMAASGSDHDAYHEARAKGKASEKKVDLKNYSKAEKFWFDLAHDEAWTVPIKDKIAAYVTQGLGIAVREAVLCLAWKQYLAEEEITVKSLKVALTPKKDDQVQYLAENYPIDGIDRGDPLESDMKAEAATPETPATEPAPKAKASSWETMPTLRLRSWYSITTILRRSSSD